MLPRFYLLLRVLREQNYPLKSSRENRSEFKSIFIFDFNIIWAGETYKNLITSRFQGNNTIDMGMFLNTHARILH